jgi:hypothetical protein
MPWRGRSDEEGDDDGDGDGSGDDGCDDGDGHASTGPDCCRWGGTLCADGARPLPLPLPLLLLLRPDWARASSS